MPIPELAPTTARRASSLNDFADRWGISRSAVYSLAKRGELRISKILGKSVILAEDEINFAARLQANANG